MRRHPDPPPSPDAAAYETALRHDRIAQIESRHPTPLPAGLRAVLRDFVRCGGDRRDRIHRFYDLPHPFDARGRDDPVSFDWAVWLGSVLWRGDQAGAAVIGPGDPLVARLAAACPRGGTGHLQVHLDLPHRSIPPVSGDRAILPLRIAAESLTLDATRHGDAVTAVTAWPLPARPVPVLPGWQDLADLHWLSPLSGPQAAFTLAVLLELAGWDVTPAHLSSGQRGLTLTRGDSTVVLAPDGRVGVSGGPRSDAADRVRAAQAALPHGGVIRHLRWPAPTPVAVIPQHLDADGVLWCGA